MFKKMNRENIVFAILAMVFLLPIVAFSAGYIGDAISVRSTTGNVQADLNRIDANVASSTSEISAIKLNLGTHEDLINTKASLTWVNNTDEILLYLLGLKLDITAMTTHENLLTAHGLPSRAGNGAKYLYLTTDETSLIWSPLTMPDLSPYAIKATTDSMEVAFNDFKSVTQTVDASQDVAINNNGIRVGSIEVAVSGGSAGQVWTRSALGYLWATIPSGITDHLLLSNIGTKTHAQLETFIGSFEVALEKIFPAVAPTDSTAFGYKTATGYGYYASSGGGGSSATVECVLMQQYTNRAQGSGASGFYRVFQFTAETALVVPNTISFYDNGVLKYISSDYTVGTWSNGGTTSVQVTTSYDIDATSSVSISYFKTLPYLMIVPASYVSTTQGNTLQQQLDSDAVALNHVNIQADSNSVAIGNLPTTTAMNAAIAAATAECQAKTWTPLVMANADYTGEVIIDTVAASQTVYNVVYSSSSGWAAAKADADATLPALGIALETGTGNKKILLRGIIRNTSWSFTKGALIYVSTATAGAITSVKPSSTGNRVQIVGVALSATVVFFNPTALWVEI